MQRASASALASKSNQRSSLPPSRIPRPIRCDLFAPPGSTTKMPPKTNGASPAATAAAGEKDLSPVTTENGQAPPISESGQESTTTPLVIDQTAISDNNGVLGENGQLQESETVTNGTDISDSATANVVFAADRSIGKSAYAVPVENGTTPAAESTVDTSWFKRACKEVNVPAPKGKRGSGDTLANQGLTTEVGPDKSHVVFSDQDNIWDGTPQILHYWFFEGTQKQKAKVREVIEEWTWYANVQFEEVTQAGESNIRITFDPDDGSWAFIGKQCEKIDFDKPTMNLAWIDRSSALTSTERATILHEFGHVLGLLHEHQSPAHGGQAVRNVQAAVDLYTKTQGWTIQKVFDQVINVYQMYEVSNFSQVDVKSIMHYPQPKELTGLSYDIPYNQKLTDLDKAYMILQYPRKVMHEKAQKDGWSFEKALKVIGAPHDVKTQVLQALKTELEDGTGEIIPQKSRTIIAEWTRATHVGNGTNDNTKKAHASTPLNGVPIPAHMANDGNNAETPLGDPAEASLDDQASINQPAKTPTTVPDKASTGDQTFVKQLYDKLSILYNPGGQQYFSLQFPTRFLDKQTYAYKLNGYFSRMEKPVVVNEAEFTLTDALYDVAPIVGGPNGQTLSRNYEKALNSLIPTFESKEVRQQREKMRGWLMKTTKAGNAAYTVDTRLSLPGITDQTAKELSDTNGIVITRASGDMPMADQESAKRIAQQAIDKIKGAKRTNPRAMTRMEYSESLMQVYLNDRKDWELRKDAMYKEASVNSSEDPSKMEAMTRELAHIAAIEEAKIAAKYADAVVRGYSHTVRGFMGHLDIKTTGESLQDAKDSFRQSSLSSAYTASQVYPVALQPADWFEALDTGFTREDLSQDATLIEAAITAKSQLIDTLETQMANLRRFNKSDTATAQKKMDEARVIQAEATANLQRKYTASTISAVKLALEVAAVANPTTAAIVTAKNGLDFLQKPKAATDSKDVQKSKDTILDLFRRDTNVLADIGTQIDAVSSATTAVAEASRVLTEYQSQYAEAVAGDTRSLVDALQRQVTSANAELHELQASYAIATRTPPSSTTKKTNEEVGTLPQNNGGSRWSEVQIVSTVTNDYTSTQSSSSSSISSYDCNFWIGSGSGSSSSAGATNVTKTVGTHFEVDVAMRTTYVTVDRSGWFDPSLFSMSKSFMRGATESNYVPWAKWKTSAAHLTTKAIRENDTSSMPEGYFAAFPIGYVLVKDCVIKITSNATDQEAFKEHFDKQCQSAGGFLCFSHSAGSRSSSDSSSSATRTTQNGIVVRIPGPQILGYIMQLTGEDKSQPFKQESIEDLLLEDEDEVPKPKGKTGPTRAHAFNPNAVTTSSSGEGDSGIRNYDDENQEPATAVGGPTTVPRAAHAFNPAMNAASTSSSNRAPGPILDALQAALGDSNVASWLESQPAGAKEELWEKLQAAFGKVV